jgi:hypothetical protein
MGDLHHPIVSTLTSATAILAAPMAFVWMEVQALWIQDTRVSATKAMHQMSWLMVVVPLAQWTHALGTLAAREVFAWICRDKTLLALKDNILAHVTWVTGLQALRQTQIIHVNELSVGQLQ